MKKDDHCPYILTADCGCPVKKWCINKDYKTCHSYKFLNEANYVKEEQKDGTENA